MKYIAAVLSLSVAWLVVGMTAVPHATETSWNTSHFRDAVWPLLNENCLACHNRDVHARGIDLSSYESLHAGGDNGSIIDIQFPERSRLIRVLDRDNEVSMPPGESSLTADQIGILTKWIGDGAIYEHKPVPVSLGLPVDGIGSFWIDRILSTSRTPIASPWGISRWIPLWPIAVGWPLILVAYLVLNAGKIPERPRSIPTAYAVAISLPVLLTAFLLVDHYQWCLDPTTLRGAQHQVHVMFGNPPMPVNINADRSLSRTYYRGNDERGEELFNNGNYRTCTFHVDAVNQKGQSLAVGESVPAGVFLKLQIDRAANTADFMFNDALMEQIFLTAEADLDRCVFSSDATHLEVFSPMQKWTATIKLFDAVDDGRYERTIYIWQHQYESPLENLSKLHYAAHVVVDIKDGEVQPTSNLWFNAMRYTQPFFSLQVPPNQWLSTDEIPELPGEENDQPARIGFGET